MGSNVYSRAIEEEVIRLALPPDGRTGRSLRPALPPFGAVDVAGGKAGIGSRQLHKDPGEFRRLARTAEHTSTAEVLILLFEVKP
jgi:hypothetical protein